MKELNYFNEALVHGIMSLIEEKQKILQSLMRLQTKT